MIRGEATVAAGGPLVAITGQHTGRSPNDKFIVQEASTSGDIWWGNVNKPITEEAFDRLHARMTEYLRGHEVFVQDLYAGADPEYRLPVRIVTHNAWHNLFAQNMFIRPAARDRVEFQPPVHRASGARVQGGSRARRHPVRRLRPVQFREAPDPDRRHLLCRRDQEEHLQRHELPAAGQGRAADALLRQYRAARRYRRVLRPVRHRQDDAVRRRQPHPDRRRRARLVEHLGLQLRRRLLRQGDQAEREGRAGDLFHHPAFRHHPRERRDGPGYPHARPGRRALHREHPRVAIRSTSSRTSARPASAASRRTSSC